MDRSTLHFVTACARDSRGGPPSLAYDQGRRFALLPSALARIASSFPEIEGRDPRRLSTGIAGGARKEKGRGACASRPIYHSTWQAMIIELRKSINRDVRYSREGNLDQGVASVKRRRDAALE